MVTLETLQKRLDDLKKSREQALANLNALAGAMQTVEELIAEMSAPVPSDSQ